MTIWVDEREPDPTWAAPVGIAPAPVRPRRWRPHPALVVVVVLALVLGLVWALGGFDRRRDQRIESAPGELISTGPYEFRFTRATAQRINRFGDKWIVQVSVYGEGRTTGDKSIAPSSISPMFWALDEQSREQQGMDGQRFRTESGLSQGSTFTPGLAMMPYTVTFEFSDSFRPGQSILLGVFDLEYSDNSLLGTGEKSWNNADKVYTVALPLTRLPDQD